MDSRVLVVTPIVVYLLIQIFDFWQALRIIPSWLPSETKFWVLAILIQRSKIGHVFDKLLKFNTQLVF